MASKSGATPRRCTALGNAHQDKQNLAVDHFKKGIWGGGLGDYSAETFASLWPMVAAWNCYFYVTDGWSVYPGFIPEGDPIVCQTDMTRGEGENTRLRHYSKPQFIPAALDD